MRRARRAATNARQPTRHQVCTSQLAFLKIRCLGQLLSGTKRELAHSFSQHLIRLCTSPLSHFVQKHLLGPQPCQTNRGLWSNLCCLNMCVQVEIEIETFLDNA